MPAKDDKITIADIKRALAPLVDSTFYTKKDSETADQIVYYLQNPIGHWHELVFKPNGHNIEINSNTYKCNDMQTFSISMLNMPGFFSECIKMRTATRAATLN